MFYAYSSTSINIIIIKALKKLRANVSHSFKFLMIENSSIEIGCIYFFQITINVFSNSSPLPTILEGLNKSTPTVMLVVYWSNFPSFRGFVQSISPL